MEIQFTVKMEVPDDLGLLLAKLGRASEEDPGLLLAKVSRVCEEETPESKEVPEPKPTGWSWAEWTKKRLQPAKTIASESYPAVALILELTRTGAGRVSAAEIRKRLSLSTQRMNAQLAWFTKRIKKEIAPEWEGRSGSTFDARYGQDGRAVYTMPLRVRELWQSLE